MGIAYERGTLLFRRERYAMAAEEFRRELAAEPNQARAHAMLSLCLLNSDRRNEAEVESRRAIELDPNYAFGYYALSLIALKAGDHPARFAFAISRQDARRRAYRRLLNASKRLMLTAIELDPLNADFLGQLAAIHFDLGDFRSALATAERGLAQLPHHQRCADIRARSLAQLGQYHEAIATVDRALATNPEQAVAHATRGWLLIRRGSAKQAAEHFREALRLAPLNDRALRGLKLAGPATRPILGAPRRWTLFFSEGYRRQFLFVLIFGTVMTNGFLQQSDIVARYVPLLPLLVLPFFFAILFKVVLITARAISK